MVYTEVYTSYDKQSFALQKRYLKCNINLKKIIFINLLHKDILNLHASNFALNNIFLYKIRNMKYEF